MKKIINLLCCVIPSKHLRHKLRDGFLKKDRRVGFYSYSQFGEDRVLHSLLLDDNLNPSDIFFIDIGCYDPIEYNNTFYFYEQFGTCGLNIDANPEAIEKFNQKRIRDINISIALADKDGDTNTYYMYDKGKEACNTFNIDLVNGRKYKPVKQIKVKTTTLNTILEKYNNLLRDKQIVLNIDIEGHEYEVLKNFNFDKYNIKYILIEVLDACKGSSTNELQKLLLDNNFVEVSKCNVTKIFKKIK